MQPEVQKNPERPSKKSVLAISLIVFSLLMLAACAQLLHMTLKNDKVYKGVYINNLDVSGMSSEDMNLALRNKFQSGIENLEIIVNAGKYTNKTLFKEINVVYEIESAASKAMAVGREGSIFQRLYAIFTAGIGGYRIDMPISYDKSTVDAFVETIYKDTLKSVKEHQVLIQEDKVYVIAGHHGENIDKVAIFNTITDMIKQAKGGSLNVDIVKTEPSELDLQYLYTTLNKDSENASFTVENGKMEIHPHSVGMKTDMNELKAALSGIGSKEDSQIIIPVEVVAPKVTTEDATAMLFKDTLGYLATHFSTSNVNDRNRGENIKLAVAKINGHILAPGDIFSFNDVVGPRTENDGYLVAHTYVAGKVVDGIGGGICQVSTTLYGAVLKADLEVLERRNHMFTVGYVPFGQDATVSYGTTDFKFQNSTAWPIKIEAGVTKGNNVFFTLVGTNETPDKKVIITQSIIKTIPFTTKYIDDPTLAAGKTVKKQTGKEGYVVDTYKTIKVGGKTISQKKLHTSSYKPLPEEIRRSTKTNPDSTPSVISSPTPSQGVDDADNPPAE